SRRPVRAGAASPRPGRATRSRTGPSALLPAVAGDRDQLLQAGLELFLLCSLEASLQDPHDLGLRAAVDEHDEAEAEFLLIHLVEIGELGQHGRMATAALLGGGPLGQVAGADRRMRVQGLTLLLWSQLTETLLCRSERVLTFREQLDEPRPALEELRELVDRQLPR